MTKTIEELARQYAEFMCPVGDYCGGVYDEQRHSDLPIYADDAKSVLSWLFGKPLASRLTAPEKEMIRRIYEADKHLCEEAKDSVFRWSEIYKGRYKLLESIFGADFFKEGE